MKIRSAALLAALSLSTVAMATPLKLEYRVEPAEGGLLRYHFTLTLDNNDGSWVPGHGYNWIVWGDAQQATTPMPDFIGDLPAPGPFADEGFTTCGGYHNGPTLLDFGTDNDFRGWVPEAVGETLEWSGTSSVDMANGQMLWSDLVGTGVHAEFATAIRTDGGGYCPADFNEDGGVDGADVEAFFTAWQDGETTADVNFDGGVDGADVETFFIAWEAGGCG